MIVNRNILASLPTVQERAYSQWFIQIEPQLWKSDEKTPLPSIMISTPSSEYLCASKKHSCMGSVNQEQILRYLRLIEVSRAMRLTEPLQNTEELKHAIKIRIYQNADVPTSLCTSPPDWKDDRQINLGHHLFTGIVMETHRAIPLQNLLSLVGHSCIRILK